VSWCSSSSNYTYTQAPTPGYPVAVLFQAILTYTQEPSLGYPGAALFQAIHTYRNLLLGILAQHYFKLYIRTGTYSQVSWCRSSLGNTYPQEPSLRITLRCPGAALFQAEHTNRNLLSGILVQLFFKLYLHTGTYSWVYRCSSVSSYKFSQEPTFGYPGAGLFQAIPIHRNILLGILVQLFFKLHIHTGTYSCVSWCNSLLSYKFTQEPTFGYPGAAFSQAIPTHTNLLSGIQVQLYFMLNLHTESNSLVSWCSSLSSCTYTQEPTLGYPGAALFQALPTHSNLLLGILVQLNFKLYIDTGTYSWVSWCSSFF